MPRPVTPDHAINFVELMAGILDPMSEAQYTVFFQLMGFPITVATFHDAERRGKLKVEKARGGKPRMSVKSAYRLMQDRPAWLQKTPRECPLPEGMVTVREAAEIRGVTIPEIMTEISNLRLSFKIENGETCPTIAIPRNALFGEAAVKTFGLMGGTPPLLPLIEIDLDLQPSIDTLARAVSESNDLARQEAAAKRSPAKSRKQTESAPTAPTETPVVPTRGPDLPVTKSGTTDLVPTMEAVAFLQSYGYVVVYNDLYRVAHCKEPKIELVRKDGKRFLYIKLEDLLGLVDAPPAWLTEKESRFPEIEGYKMTRYLQVTLQFVPSRLYQAIRAGLIEAVNPTAGEGQGKLFYIADSEVERVLQDTDLVEFLRGNKVTIDEITDLVQSRPEPQTTHQEIPVPEAPDPSEIVHVEGIGEPVLVSSGPAETTPETELSLGEVLVGVHRCRTVVDLYELAVAEAWSDEKIVENLGPLVPKEARTS